MTPDQLWSIHERRLKEMVRALRGAQSILESRVMSAIRAAMDEPKKALSASFWSGRLIDTDAALESMRARYLTWVGNRDRGAIVNAIRDGSRMARGVLVEAALERRRNRLPFDAKTIGAFIDDTALTFSSAIDSAETGVRRLFRATQQGLLRDAEVNRLLTAEQLAQGTPRTMANSLADALLERADGSKFVEINGRNYGISDYAELTARTRTREAQSVGTIRTTLQYGVSLVRWVPSNPCKICSAIVKSSPGGIFSIHGNHEKYQSLEIRPPAHPRCMCVIVPYVDEAVAEDAA